MTRAPHRLPVITTLATLALACGAGLARAEVKARAPRPATAGTQDDPGTAGDGTVPQPGPYAPPPEALARRAGVPAGAVLGPFLYEAKGRYEGWTPGWRFRYWLYVPARYRPGHRAALLVLQDGRHYVGDPAVSKARFNAPTVFDNLIAEGTMPVTIGVFIDPGSPTGAPGGGGDPDRSKQYDTPNDQYAKFLVDEFLPATVLAKYDIVTDPDGWAIGGHSSGGIAAFAAAWFFPDRFRKVLSASASFSNTGGSFPRAILSVPRRPLRVYLSSGTHDLRDWFAQNSEAARILAQQGYHFRFRTSTDVHFPPTAAAADVPDALRWLWRGYRLP